MQKEENPIAVSVEDVNSFNQLAKPNVLTYLREVINWDNENDRVEFLRQLYFCIGFWKGPLPQLQYILRPVEINWLLLQDALLNETFNGSGVPLIDFVIRSGYKDEPPKDLDGKPIHLHRTTALHYAANYIQTGYDTIPKLFQIYGNIEANYMDEVGFTHFHAVCAAGHYGVAEKFLELGQDPNCLLPRESSCVHPPLHLALENGHRHIFELLLMYGADPNLANAEGLTPLQTICVKGCDEDLARMLFDLSHREYHPVQLNSRDSLGSTPLHMAIPGGHIKFIELLLRQGADSIHTDSDGQRDHDDDNLRQKVEIDALDELGNAPLHLALVHDQKDVVQVLLRYRADPNLANAEGSAPLHLICQRKYDDDLLEMFLKTNHDYHGQRIEIDKKDKFGWTPLQLAVANHLPNCVDLLLDNGADLTNFIFPSYKFIDKCLSTYEMSFHTKALDFISLYRLLKVLDCLEQREYRLESNVALQMMSIFVHYEKVTDSTKLRFLRSREQERELLLTMPLKDFIRLRPDEAEQLFASMSNDELTSQFSRTCIGHLCAAVTRAFFRRWALEFFLSLTSYRLPILCCETIIAMLPNRALLYACIAASERRKEAKNMR